MNNRDRRHLVKIVMHNLANRTFPVTETAFREACKRGWTMDTRLPSHEYVSDSDFTRVCYHQFSEEEIAEIIAGAGLN
jgi:hypothetical protein